MTMAEMKKFYIERAKAKHKNESDIIVENIHSVLTSDELSEIKENLKSQQIEIEFREADFAKNSIFDGFDVYIGAALTSLFLNGLLYPAAFEAIKYTFHIFYSKCINKFKTISYPYKEAKDSSLNLCFSNENIEITAPVPNNLSDAQFSMYMEMLQKTIIGADKTYRSEDVLRESLIIEYETSSDSFSTKTTFQYVNEKIKQQNNSQ